jgi:hypothetical protein
LADADEEVVRFATWIGFIVFQIFKLLTWFSNNRK